MIEELQILGKLLTPSISKSDRVENCKKSEGCYLFQGYMICFCRMTLLLIDCKFGVIAIVEF